MAIFCSFFFAFERGSKGSKRAPFCLYATCVCGRVLDFQRIRQLQNIFTDLRLIGQPSSLGSDAMVKKQKVRRLLSYPQSAVKYIIYRWSRGTVYVRLTFVSKSDTWRNIKAVKIHILSMGRSRFKGLQGLFCMILNCGFFRRRAFHFTF